MVAGASLASIGVEAVIEGIGDFISGLADMTKAVTGFGDEVGLLGRIFQTVTAPISAFLGFLRDVAVVAGGILMRDAILFLVNGLKAIVAETIQSGIEFQKLKVRLDTLIARQVLAADSSLSFGKALEIASAKASDLFVEITRLALTSPFDIEDVANVFSLATSYGFAAEAALEVTQAVLDFTAGMGLSNIEAERVIVNLGQMIQLGKVTQREMTDLARGAFVPVNDVLAIMAENLGITTEALATLREDGLLPASTFIEAFIQLVGEEFPEAAQRAARTLEGVTDNIKDLIQGVLGFNVVRPVLDAIAAPLADIIDIISDDDRLIGAAITLGEVLSGIAEDILGFLPTAQEMAEFILVTFENIVGIIDLLSQGNFDAAFILFLNTIGFSALESIDILGNLERIIAGFQEGGILGGLAELGIVLPQPLLDFFDNLKEALENLKLFWDENGEAILDIFDDIFVALGGAAGKVGKKASTSILDSVGTAIVNLSEALVENGPAIVENLGKIRDFINDEFLPGLQDLADWLSDNKFLLLNVFGSMALALVFAGLITLTVLFIILAIAMAPVLIIVTAVGLAFGVVALMIFLLLQAALALNDLPNIFTTIWHSVQTKAIISWDIITTLYEAWLTALKNIAVDKLQDIVVGIILWGVKLIISFIGIFAAVLSEVVVWGAKLLTAVSLALRTLAIVIGIILGAIVTTFTIKAEEWKTAITSIDWVAVGLAVAQGIADGIEDGAIKVLDALMTMARNAWNAIVAFFDAKSPSRLMMLLGEDISAGLAQGIINAANMPTIAMGAMAGQATMAAASMVAAAPAMAGATTNVTNNHNMNINTSAPSEPIIQDFEFMRSLARG